jgi:flagellar hook-associated protein 1 FlgK
MSDIGLSIAGSGLAADAAEIDTISNNLSNIDTAGYAAEQVNLSPEAANGPFGAGQGVLIGSITNITDAVFSAANVAAQGASSEASQFNQVMSSIESIFPEPSSNGISSQLTSLWSAISTLATNPNQVGAEQAAVSAAQSVASSISSSFAQLSQLSSSLQSQVGTGSNDGGLLTEANALLSQVATLNTGIVEGRSGGQNPNALSDQVTADVNQLATLLGANAVTQANGTTTVYLSGVQLVSGNVAQSLGVTGSGATTNLAVTTGNGVVVSAGGSIGANVTAVNTTMPDYMQQLDGVADSLATNLNSIQASGMDAAGDPGVAIAGGYAGTILPPIFVNNGSSNSYTTASGAFNSAATIEVAPALLASPSLIATAAAPGPTNSNLLGAPTLDGSNAQAMAALAALATGPDATYQTLIGALGNQAASASALSTMSSAQAQTAANNLSSISGVNENNEEVALMAAQNAFQATSQLVNAINESFQSLLSAV